MSTQNLTKEYTKLSNQVKDLSLNDKLLIISNLLFDCYEDCYKADILYKDLQPSKLTNLENYSELKDTYAFKENSFVFNTLESAHTILSTSIHLNSLITPTNK